MPEPLAIIALRSVTRESRDRIIRERAAKIAEEIREGFKKASEAGLFCYEYKISEEQNQATEVIFEGIEHLLALEFRGLEDYTQLWITSKKETYKPASWFLYFGIRWDRPRQHQYEDISYG